MGVLVCNRNGCDGIMCEYYSIQYGYLCTDCYNELLSKPYVNIKGFMESSKEHEDSKFEWEAYVKDNFTSRY